MSTIIHKIFLKKSKNKLPNIHAIFKANGPIYLSASQEDLFTHMARLLCSQQLSLSAADTIWRKIMSQLELDNYLLFDACNDSYIDKIKSCGLSSNKVKALMGLKNAFTSEQISNKLLSNKSHPEVVKLISSLWGFGPWSGDMIAMFYLGLEDVWSNGDLILNRGIRTLSENTTYLDSELLEFFSPYKSYLALHIWKATNSKLL